MPTESAFLLAGLLFLAAALGYIFAKFGDEDEGEISAEQLNADYMRGLNYVLNEEPDRAVEVFTRMAELDDEALETHFALGSLFRKRGEVDRAIRVHQNLIARPTLSKEQKFQAEAALAEDFLSAGLFDRAEEMFLQLAGTPEFRIQALRRLQRIYEVTRDWEHAVEVTRDLDKLEARRNGKSDRSPSLAHYFCELAEEAWAGNNRKSAATLLKQAEGARPGTVRSALLGGDFAAAAGDSGKAIALYQQVIESAPDLLVDVLPRLAACHRAVGTEADLSRWLEALLAPDGTAATAVAMAVVRNAELQNPVAIEAFQQFVADDPTLSRLVDSERLAAADPAERTRIMDGVRDALRQIVSARPGYFCTQCGYACLVMQWQCPGCHAWETVRPIVRISLVGSA